MKYEFLPHTADIKFRAYGKDIEEAFSNSALALTAIMIEPEKVKAKVSKIIDIKAEDEKALLYDFLEYFLVLLDSEGFLLNSVRSLSIEGLRLQAEVVGDNELDKYEVETHIKAITYQEMIIEKQKDKYMIQVIPDL